MFKQQLYLTGFMFSDTVFACLPNKLVVLTSKKKVEVLRPATEGSAIPCEFLIRNKVCATNKTEEDKKGQRWLEMAGGGMEPSREGL